ncbi:hypothetical protein ACFLYL_00800 [Chloroflexota bacterium]
MLVFIKELILATLYQMTSLFGGIVIFGLAIHVLSQLTFKALERAFGRNGVYLVAWLGTPIHEASHALFCLIFFHKIIEIRFFRPDPVTGTLGYVQHTWNRKNPWQVLGNLFIGIGPVILGCMVLFAVFYVMISDSSQAWNIITTRVNEIDRNYSIGNYFNVLALSLPVMLKLIFTAANITTFMFWVFLYLSICIASNIRLSTADIKHIFSGMGCLVLPFLVINLLGLITGSGGNRFFPFTASSLGIVYSLLILSLVLVLTGFVLIYFMSTMYYKLKHGRFLKPF